MSRYETAVGSLGAPTDAADGGSAWTPSTAAAGSASRPETDADPVTPGEKIRRRREAAGLTQQDLAEMAGVSRGTVRNVEAGQGEPTSRTLRDLTDALNRIESGNEEPFSDEVRRRRLAAGMTQVNLAERSGVSLATVQAVESGRTQSLRVVNVNRIRAALDRAAELSTPCACTAEIEALATELAEERAAHQQTLATLRAIRALLDSHGGA